MADAATLTGLVNLDAPDLSLITPAAIAAALGKLNRWAGNTQLPISVAHHSVLVEGIFRARNPSLGRHAIHALLHDAHGYLLGDLTAPFERQLAERIPGFSRHVEAIKLSVDASIRQALGIEPPTIEIAAAVHEADRMAAAAEWRCFLTPANGPCPYPSAPRGIGIKPLTWDRAEDLFRTHLEAELATLRKRAA